MRALVFSSYGGPLAVEQVPDPAPSAYGVVVEVGATGICRSDWHGWQGHDPDIALPHVPGHELAGTVVAVGEHVRRWRGGERVTVPFVCACGACTSCAAGEQQVCERQTQPGFTHWGSFAELVALHDADVNLVALPPSLSFGAAAALGCRYATAFRAIVQQGRVRAGEVVAVHGCGGVGLSAVQVAVASGARVVAVDPSRGARSMALSLGADYAVADSSAVTELTGGGAHLSLDCFGSPSACAGSVLSLRRRGRHVQVGLLPDGAHVPMERVVAYELSVLGSHGMAAHAYPPLLELVVTGRLRPDLLVTREIGLDQAGEALRDVGDSPGITVVTSF